MPIKRDSPADVITMSVVRNFVTADSVSVNRRKRVTTATNIVHYSLLAKKLHKNIWGLDIMDPVDPTVEPVEDASHAPAPAEEPQVLLTDIPVTNDNVALNLMVAFLDAAQKRGAFSINESAKIWECIQRFIQK
jgi:hypothetical protein